MANAQIGSCPARKHYINYARWSENRLWELRNTDADAREELTRRYLPLSERLAWKYRNSSESQEDLKQVAALGLTNAVARYDPSTNVPFSGFAAPTINGELKRYFRDRAGLIRVPRRLQEEIMAVEKAVDELRATNHGDPDKEEIVDYTGIDREELNRVMAAKHQRAVISLNQPCHEEGRTIEETVGEPDTGIGLVEELETFREAINSLDSMDRFLLRLRYVDGLTQLEMAERVGCSQMQISRILKRSTEQLCRHSGHVSPEHRQSLV